MTKILILVSIATLFVACNRETAAPPKPKVSEEQVKKDAGVKNKAAAKVSSEYEQALKDSDAKRRD